MGKSNKRLRAKRKTKKQTIINLEEIAKHFVDDGDKVKRLYKLLDLVPALFRYCQGKQDNTAYVTSQFEILEEECRWAKGVILQEITKNPALSADAKGDYLKQWIHYIDRMYKCLGSAFERGKFDLIEYKQLENLREGLIFQKAVYERAYSEHFKTEPAKSTQPAEADLASKKPNGGKAKSPKAKKKLDYTHSEDYTSVVWCGKSYQFTKTQALCVKYLWAEWEKSEGFGLSEKTIGDKIGSSADNYKLKHTFRVKRNNKSRQHPAWGKMIVSSGKGMFCLKSSRKK